MEENGAGYRPVEAAGMVYLNTGDNQLLKGKNIATGGFDFPITNATVTVDGKVVIKDGKLTF
jgi:aminopeptidase